MKRKVTIHYGYGLVITTIVLAALKVANLVDIGWGWVFAPLWAPWALMFVISAIAVVVIGMYLPVLIWLKNSKIR